MATIDKRGNLWRARIYDNSGKRKTKSFPTKQQATLWANKQEIDKSNRHLGIMPEKYVEDLLIRYRDEVSPSKGGYAKEVNRINRIVREDALAQVSTKALSPSHVVTWRDTRLKSVCGSSVNREWNTLSAIFTTAIREWEWLTINPMSSVKRPSRSKPRTRRPSDDEIAAILEALKFDNKSTDTISRRIGFTFLFAIETAMRCGEICNIRREDVLKEVVHLPKTKNGYSRDVPLSTEAKRILSVMMQNCETMVFDLKPSQVDATFRKARRKAGVTGLTFHDSRREALTRLSKKVDVMMLAKISGHRDLSILQNVYYAPNMNEVSKLLD